MYLNTASALYLTPGNSVLPKPANTVLRWNKSCVTILCRMCLTLAFASKRNRNKDDSQTKAAHRYHCLLGAPALHHCRPCMVGHFPVAAKPRNSFVAKTKLEPAGRRLRFAGKKN